MKKHTICAIAIFAIIAPSCKKNYVCECSTKVTYSALAGGGSDTFKDDALAYTNKMSKKNAQAACDAEKASLEKSLTNVYSENGADLTYASVLTSCTLK